MIELHCSECDSAFRVSRKQRNRATCSPDCKKVRDKRLRAYRRRLARTGLRDYPINLPRMGLTGEERKARREASWDVYARQRPGKVADPFVAEDLSPFDDDDDDELVIPSENPEPGFRRSVVLEVADGLFDDSELVSGPRAAELIDTVAPDDPPGRLHGLGGELRRMWYRGADYETVVSSPSASWDSSGWTIDDDLDTDDRPEGWSFLRRWAIPREAFAVGRTCPELRTIGSQRPYQDTYVKPRVVNEKRPGPAGSLIQVLPGDADFPAEPSGRWPIEDVIDLVMGCSVTPLPKLEPFSVMSVTNLIPDSADSGNPLVMAS